MQDYTQADDPELLKYLESAKMSLHTHYKKYYANHAHSLNDTANTVQSAMDDSLSNVDFTSRYKKKDHKLRDELEEYFKLPREDFDACKPLEWWVGRQAQFPNLFRLARDLISIPGIFFFDFLYSIIAYIPHQDLL